MDHHTSEPARLKPSFEEFASFVRDWAGIPQRKQIVPETLFEDDLGITGDDGCDLLEETERRFGVCLSSAEHGCRRTFSLDSNEYLFHSEGFGINLLALLRGDDVSSVVREFTVGELFDAVLNAPPNNVTRAP